MAILNAYRAEQAAIGRLADLAAIGGYCRRAIPLPNPGCADLAMTALLVALDGCAFSQGLP